MRVLLAAFALLSLVVAAAPHATALLPSECAQTNGSTAADFAWSPGCVRLTSGDVVTFGNADDVLHNARSSLDDNAVFRALGPLCFQTRDLAEGQTAQVRFVHDSDGVTASVRNDDGSWGPVHDCSFAEDPTALAPNDAAIAFKCGIHSTMTGRIVVTKIG